VAGASKLAKPHGAVQQQQQQQQKKKKKMLGLLSWQLWPCQVNHPKQQQRRQQRQLVPTQQACP
jgi:hypothetical protein